MDARREKLLAVDRSIEENGDKFEDLKSALGALMLILIVEVEARHLPCIEKALFDAHWLVNQYRLRQVPAATEVRH